VSPKKSVVIKKRVEARAPKNLIELLVLQKSYMYDREQRMKLFKEQDEEEEDKMRKEYDTSSDEDDDEENFVWCNSGDPDVYLTLGSQNKTIYEKD